MTRRKSSTSARRALASFFSHFYLAITSIIVLVPILWMITASLSKGKLLSSVPLIPKFKNFSLEHYKWLFTYKSDNEAVLSDFTMSFFRTFMVACVTTVTVVFLTSITGYLFSRFKFKGKKTMLLGMMLLQMFPSFMGIIALFLLFRSFGWINKPVYLSFIYMAQAIPTNTFLLRGYLKGIPISIDEAATIDGASPTRIFFSIHIPLMKPMLGFLAVSAFMTPWMDYMLPFNLLDRQHETIALFLLRITDPLQPTYYNPLHFMAGALLIAVPIMIVQISMQKYIIYGMASGAEKG